MSSVHPRVPGHPRTHPLSRPALLGNRMPLTRQGLSWRHLGSRPGPALCGLLSQHKPEGPEICFLVPPVPSCKGEPVQQKDQEGAPPSVCMSEGLSAGVPRPPCPYAFCLQPRTHALSAGPSKWLARRAVRMSEPAPRVKAAWWAGGPVALV